MKTLLRRPTRMPKLGILSEAELLADLVTRLSP
jgi:hypothetical protein